MQQSVKGTLTGHVDRDGRRLQFSIDVGAAGPNRPGTLDNAPAFTADQAALHAWYADLVHAIQALGGSVAGA